MHFQIHQLKTTNTLPVLSSNLRRLNANECTVHEEEQLRNLLFCPVNNYTHVQSSFLFLLGEILVSVFCYVGIINAALHDVQVSLNVTSGDVPHITSIYYTVMLFVCAGEMKLIRWTAVFKDKYGDLTHVDITSLLYCLFLL